MRMNHALGKWAVLACIATAGLTGCISLSGSLESETTVVEQKMEENPFIGMVRHIVLYAYKPDTTASKIAELERMGEDMLGDISVIEDQEHGTIFGAGARAQGYTHCIIFTYEDKDDLQEYIDHPDHQAFVAQAFPYLSQMLVFDYVAED